MISTDNTTDPRTWPTCDDCGNKRTTVTLWFINETRSIMRLCDACAGRYSTTQTTT